MYRLYVCMLLIAAISMAEESSEERLLARATNRFTTRMFSEVVKSKPGKSIILSAFSVMPLLAQLGLASAGKSHDELLKSIGMPTDNATKATFSQLNKRLKSIKDVELRMANKIYVAKNEELNKDFAAVSKDVFNSEVQNVDFGKNVESAEEINSWVENETNHRIKNLVSPSMLSSETRVVLVNAIYFKGTWKYPFLETATTNEDFHVTKDKVIKVPTMYAKYNYRYVDSRELNAQIIELPYSGENASMVIVLPRDIDGINELQYRLTRYSVISVLDSMKETEIEVYLPKFKIETTTDLKEILQNMSVTRLFSPEQAQLNNLLKETNNIYVSDAIQKAFIEVNEKGAEAAASNSFYLPLIVGGTPVFKANRPFYFILKINSVPLFSGVKIIE